LNANYIHFNIDWIHFDVNCIQLNANWNHVDVNCIQLNANWNHFDVNWIQLMLIGLISMLIGLASTSNLRFVHVPKIQKFDRSHSVTRYLKQRCWMKKLDHFIKNYFICWMKKLDRLTKKYFF